MNRLKVDTLGVIGSFLGVQSSICAALVSKNIAIEMVANHCIHSSQTYPKIVLLRSLLFLLKFSSQEWKTFSNRTRKRPKKTTWMETATYLSEEGCKGCGKKTKRIVFGQRFCLPCNRNPRKKDIYMVSKGTAKRILKAHGVAQTKVFTLPYYRCYSGAHLIHYQVLKQLFE